MSASEIGICTKKRKVSAPNRESRKLWDAITSIVEDPAYEDMTMGVRMIYYQCVTRKLVPANNKNQYRRVQRAVLQMRRQGVLPWWKIRDGLREREHYTQYPTLEMAVDTWAKTYRRDVMRQQAVHLEVWIEKDSLIGFISDIAWDYGLTFAALRGQPSESFLWESGDAWSQLNKPVVVLYAGDFDSSGWFIGSTLQTRVQDHYDNVTVRHIGLNMQQVEQYNLPESFEAKPTDKNTPAFVRMFGNRCVELDALPPHILRQLYRDEIERTIDMDLFNAERRTEALERETANRMRLFVRRSTIAAD
jgi:hypothetical protein